MEQTRGLLWLTTALFFLSAFISALLCFTIANKWVRYNRLRRHRQLIEQQFPYSLEILSASLRAGITLPIALQHLADTCAAPLSNQWRTVYQEQRLGFDIDHALENFSRRNQSTNIAMAISMIQIAYSRGAPLASILETISQTMRNQSLLQDKLFTLTAQGRLQGKFLSLLPLLLLIILQIMEPESMKAFWQTPEGWFALSIVIILESLGLWFIQRLTRLDI